jgi:hypothetical protein
MGAYPVDLESMLSHFPEPMPVPPLLRAFAEFVAGSEHGSLGWFDAMQSEPLDENVLGDHDATLLARERLGLFLSLPDGSQLALWKHDESDVPAVVLVESEGQHRTLAPSLEAMLLAWTQGKTGVNDLDDADAGSGRAALGEWLVARGISTMAAKGPKPKLPSLSTWFKSTLKAAKEARDKAAKAKGPKARRTKPTLGTPTAESVADVVPRALTLLERLITDPEVGAFFAELGFDVLGITKPDVLRNLVLPDLGLQFEIDWPWSGQSERLDAAYPRAVRPDLEREKARMFKAIQALPSGYRSWNNGTGGYVQFQGYPGKLPGGILLTDDREALVAKMGPPSKIISDNLYWEDAKTNRRLLASYSAGEALPKGSIERLVWLVT